MPREHSYTVYILASGTRGTLYTGVTNDLARRLDEHRNGEGGAFTRRYNVTRLVWYEEWQDVELAIAREKAIKKWRRDWKINLIEKDNRWWDDRCEELGL